MTSRNEKGKRVARYLTGHSAIPNLRYDADSQMIEAPYSLKMTTDAAAWRFFQYVKELPEGKIAAVIRFDKYIGSIDDAVVAIRLEAFAELLKAYHEKMSDMSVSRER